MLNYDQREALEEIEFSGMDVAYHLYELIGSSSIEKLSENLRCLILEAKYLVEKAEELQRLAGVTEDKG